MSEVILVVPARSECRDRLIAAAQRLASLAGAGRVVELSAPNGVAARPPDWPIAAGPAPVVSAAEVEARGGRADFLVVAQPSPSDDKTIRQAFRTALFRTERPVLMVPRGRPVSAFGRLVAIAWRDDAQTLRALMPALRLLASAEEVHLLAGVRVGAPTPAIPSVFVEHSVPATLHVLSIGSAPFGEVLLSRARELGADMLIMGAHAHSPLREMLLGGVTSYVVAHADLPVLLRN